MKDLINLKDKHYVVQHLDKTYAVNSSKYPLDSLDAGRVVGIHPVSKVGIINYNEIVMVKSNLLKVIGQPVGMP